MTRNPYINALSATTYITFVVFLMFNAERMVPNKSFVGPIVFLSLFTLSAAFMGFTFLYQPAQLYFDGKKKQGLDLFLKTLISFAVITIVLVSLLFSGVIK